MNHNEKYISQQFIEEGIFSNLIDPLFNKFLNLNKKFKSYFTVTEKDLKKNGIDVKKRKNNIKKIVKSLINNTKSSLLKQDSKKFISEFVKANKLVALEIKSFFKEAVIDNVSNISNMTKSIILAIIVYPLMFFTYYAMSGFALYSGDLIAKSVPVLGPIINEYIWKYTVPLFCGIFSWFILPFIEEGAMVLAIKGGFGGSYFTLTSVVDTFMYFSKGIQNMISKRALEFSQISEHLAGALWSIFVKAVKFSVYVVGSAFKFGWVAFLINVVINNFQRLFFQSPLAILHKNMESIIIPLKDKIMPSEKQESLPEKISGDWNKYVNTFDPVKGKRHAKLEDIKDKGLAKNLWFIGKENLYRYADLWDKIL